MQALIDGQVIAIKIANFVAPDLCHKLSDWYQTDPRQQAYTTEYYLEGSLIQVDQGVIRIGSPYNLTYGKAKDDPIYENYYADAPVNTKKRKDACTPHLDPIDKLISQLNKIYVHGAKIASFDHRPMFAGIGRITQAYAQLLEAQPHFDALPQSFSLENQFGANFYFEVPKEGGELEVWDYPCLTPNEISMISPDKDWRFELGKSILIKPQKGDLIIISTRLPHAVRMFQEGKRISLNCFIGYRRSEALLLWS
ncbi:MAG: 2OG-Fe(II) oxygenase [Microcoleus sp.]